MTVKDLLLHHHVMKAVLEKVNPPRGTAKTLLSNVTIFKEFYLEKLY